MTVETHVQKWVSIPISDAGLIKMQDLRDFIEATGDAPEDYYVHVLDGELRYEES